MPIYEYECKGCGKLHEIMQKITEPALKKCPDCGGDMKRLISNTSFVLKGTGWYMTDYASNKRSPSTEPKTGNGAGNGSKNGEAKKEKKSETKAAAASK
jgi:putative FmdB family regulatory protein